MRRVLTRSNRYFAFLRRLRSAGRNNMYGAIPYLMDAFGIERNEAFRVVCEFMDASAAEENEARPRPRPTLVPLAGEREPTLFDAVTSPEADSRT